MPRASVAAAADHTRHDCNRRREPGGHHGAFSVTRQAIDRSNVTYFIGRETVVGRKDGKGLPWLVEVVFSFMLRNSSEAIDYYHLPRDEVVEIGRQFAI
jgi:K+ transporter